MSAIPEFFPWQRDRASAWLDQRERFAHAWLIHGMAGIGKHQFALAAAASLLCESPRRGMACGQCAACVWVASGNHPDLRRVRPDAIAFEEDGQAEENDSNHGAAKKTLSKEIRVDQLRRMASWFNTATHRGGWRVAVLYPAQSLNTISANALLKVLEEPPEHTVFLIVADAPDRLLPTLVSRCRRLPLAPPSEADSLAWLKAQGLATADQWLAAAGGAPVRALQLAEERDTACPPWLDSLLAPLSLTQTPDLGALADTLEKQSPTVWIDTLQRLFLDLLLAASGVSVHYFPALGAKTAATAQRASRLELAQTSRWLSEQRAVSSHPLNAKLLTHAVLLRVISACAPAA